jgi:hypothetical protein
MFYLPDYAIFLIFTIGIILIVFMILAIIGEWKVFKKAGLAPWTSLIPIYNMYCHIVEVAKLHWGYFAAIIIVPIISRFVVRLAYSFYDIIGYGSYRTISTGFTVITSLALFAINIIMCSKTSKNFGKGIGFTIGLIFLFPIFIFILGFGNATFNFVKPDFPTPKPLPKFKGFSKKDDYFDIED